MTPSVQPSTRELNRPEIFVNAATLNEGRLVDLDYLMDSWGQAECKAFGEELADGMNEADRPIIPETVRRLSFVEEHHGCSVEMVEAPEVHLP